LNLADRTIKLKALEEHLRSTASDDFDDSDDADAITMKRQRFFFVFSDCNTNVILFASVVRRFSSDTNSFYRVTPVYNWAPLRIFLNLSYVDASLHGGNFPDVGYGCQTVGGVISVANSSATTGFSSSTAEIFATFLFLVFFFDPFV